MKTHGKTITAALFLKLLIKMFVISRQPSCRLNAHFTYQKLRGGEREGLTLFFHEFHRKHKRAGTKTSLSWSEEWKLCAEGSAGRLASAALCSSPFLQSGRSVYKFTSDTRMETTAGFYKASTPCWRSFPTEHQESGGHTETSRKFAKRHCGGWIRIDWRSHIKVVFASPYPCLVIRK